LTICPPIRTRWSGIIISQGKEEFSSRTSSYVHQFEFHSKTRKSTCEWTGGKWQPRLLMNAIQTWNHRFNSSQRNMLSLPRHSFPYRAGDRSDWPFAPNVAEM
jgi:hypothetical protein